METIDEFPRPQRGRPPKYPWEDWFTGDIVRLKKGEDFDVGVKSFRALAHRSAKSHRFNGRAETQIQGNTVVVRFIQED